MGVFDIRGCGQQTPDGDFDVEEPSIEVLISASAVVIISRQNLIRGIKNNRTSEHA